MSLGNIGSQTAGSFSAMDCVAQDDNQSKPDLKKQLTPSPDEAEAHLSDNEHAAMLEDFAECDREKMALAHSLKEGVAAAVSPDPEKALAATLQATSAAGDDRNLASHGHNRKYWYSIGDSYRLLLAIRKNTLTYTNEAVGGEEYRAHRENSQRVLITDPYYLDNFAIYLADDIKRINGSHEIPALNRAWAQPPQIIIIPVLTGCHWRCVRVKLEYTDKKIHILFDDPYGKHRFDETIKTRLRNALNQSLSLLFKKTGLHDDVSLSSIIDREEDKEINQQGTDNGYDCGPIVFRNIADYARVDKRNQDLSQGVGLYVTKADDDSHEKLMRELRTSHIHEYSEISGLKIDEDRIADIKSLMQVESKTKLAALHESNGIDAGMQSQIAGLPPQYVSMIFHGVDELKLTIREALDSVIEEYRQVSSPRPPAKSVSPHLFPSKHLGKQGKFGVQQATPDGVTAANAFPVVNNVTDIPHGLKKSLHGNLYQLKLLMLLLHRGLEKNYEFFLETEKKAAEAFDDIVFRYREPGKENYIYRFIQVKHTQTLADKTGISATDLFYKSQNQETGKDQDKGNYSLHKYFNSWKKITANFKKDKKDEWGEFCIYTNQDFYWNPPKTGRKQLKTDFDLNAAFEEVKEEDSILQTSYSNAKKWKFKEQFTEKSKLYILLSKSNSLEEQKEIDDFLAHLVFAVNQPDEITLGKMIQKELGEVFNLINSKVIYDSFQRAMLDWMKSKGTSALTKNDITIFFTDMKEELSQLTLIAPTLIYQKNFKKHKIAFKNCQTILAFLKSPAPIMVYEVKSLFLGGMRVYNTLKNNDYRQNNRYIFIEATEALKLKNVFTNGFASSQLLVLICDNVGVSAPALAKLLLPRFNKTRKQQIIFITTDSQAITHTIPESISIFSTPHPQTQNGFADLTPESQQALQNIPILFQGKDIPLQGIISPKLLSDTIDAEILEEIIKNEGRVVGEKLSFKETMYIERLFKHGVHIKEEALKENGNDFFAISGMTNEELSKILPSAAIRPFKIEDQDKEREKKSPSRYIILDMANALAQFQQLRTLHATNTIHFLKREGSQFIWQQSYGNLSNLSGYVDKKSVDLLNNTHILISAEPGMGKSTVISRLAYDLQEKNPEKWVVKISLLSMEDKLKKFNFINNQRVIDFFMEGATLLAKKIFAHRLNSDNSVSLYLDGFDEIQEKQQVKVIKLLQQLKATKAQIVITTRLHMQEKLENELGVFSHALILFADEDIIKFLKGFWKEELKNLSLDLVKFNSKVESYAPKLIKKFGAAINDMQNKFIGIPLQAKLFAVAFLESFKRFYIEENNEPIFPESLGLYALYQRFMEAKYQIFLENKADIASREYGNTIKFFLKERLEKIHQRLGFNLLFSTEKIVDKLSTVEQKLLNATGIIQFTKYEQKFIHHTFAEYFAAIFLVQQLKKDKEPKQKYKEILLKEIFKKRHAVVYKFIDEQISLAKYIPLQKKWDEIRSYNLLRNVTPTFPIQHAAASTDLSTMEIEDNWIKTKKVLEDTYCLYVGMEKVHNAEAFCRAVLSIMDVEKLEKSISLLHLVGRHNEDFVIFGKALLRDMPLIYLHYFKMCQAQKLDFDRDLIKNIYFIVKDLPTCLIEKPEITTTFIRELTLGKIFYLLLRQDSSIKLSFRLVKEDYSPYMPENVSLEKKCNDLASIETSSEDFIKKLRDLLIEENKFNLLYLLSLTFKECELDKTNIEVIFKQQKIENNIAYYLADWLKNSAIYIVNNFKILTVEMAKIFNQILTDSPKDVEYYASRIWENLLQKILDETTSSMLNKGIDRVALMTMCVKFMNFSVEESVAKPDKISPFTLTLTSIKNILKIIQDELNRPNLNEEILALCIEQLYLIKKTGLLFIDFDRSSFLILDATTESAETLELDYDKTPIKELLVLKSHGTVDKTAFEQECKRAIKTIKEQQVISLDDRSKRRASVNPVTPLLTASPTATAAIGDSLYSQIPNSPTAESVEDMPSSAMQEDLAYRKRSPSDDGHSPKRHASSN